MNRPKVAIQYGILSGSLIGRRVRKALHEAGYTHTKNSDEADIIIAHSAGCFWLPEAPTTQKLLLIDPPYWPDRTIKERARARTKSNLHFRPHGYAFRYWLIRNIWGFYYAIRDFKRTRRIIHHAPNYDLPSIIRGHNAILVRNKHDDWLTPDLDDIQRANPALLIKYMPGDHEDWIYHPKPYVDLLQLLQE